MRRKSPRFSTYAALLVIASAWHPTSQAGIRLYTETAIEGGDKERSVHVSMEITAEGEQGKFLVLSSQHEAIRKGRYMITQDAGKTLYLVDPSRKQYALWDINEGSQYASDPIFETYPNVAKLGTPHTELISRGRPDGKLLGFPVRRYQYRTTYTTSKNRPLGRDKITTHIIDRTLWTTQKLRHPALDVWLRTQAPSTGHALLDRQNNRIAKQLVGTPLKIITAVRHVDKDNELSGNIRLIVKSIKSERFQAQEFALPVDYEKVDLDLLVGGKGGMLERFWNQGRGHTSGE